MLDPRNIPSADLDKMRAEAAREHNVSAYAQYSEKRAPEILKLDNSTVRRNRRAGRIPYVSYGNGGVRYLGVQLVDYILFGERAVLLWGGSLNENTSPESSG